MAISKWLRVRPGWRRCFLGLVLIGVFITSGCTTLYDPETAQEDKHQIVATITQVQPIGQTFISRRAGLNGITLWLEPVSSNTNLTLDLYHSPADTHPLYHTVVLPHSGENAIAIPPQNDPPNQGYYVQLSSSGADIQVYGRDEEIYPHGSLYEDRRPSHGDLAFRATYEYGIHSVIADLQTIIQGSWLVIPLILLLLIPGWLILDLTGYSKEFDIGEQIGLSSGLSIALVPILMLWTTTLGLKWQSGSVGIVAGTLALIILIRLLRKKKRPGSPTSSSKLDGQSLLNLLALLAIFSTTTFVRVAMIRDLAAPAWVDSIHHSLITQSIIDNGGYPQDYLPHIPIEANQYHPGFHSLLAAFQWLTGLQAPDSMLIFGQLLNGWMIFAVYLLGTTFLKDKRSALIAALVSGLLVLMPAYYTSWGRYTQLAGLLVLPAGYRWTYQFSKFPPKIKSLIPGGILLAGLFMIHYRVLIFLGCLFLADWVGNLYRSKMDSLRCTIASIKSTVLFGLTGILMALPWLAPTLSQFVIQRVLRWGGSPAFSDVHWNYLTPVFGIPVMILAGLGLLLGSFRKRRFVIKILIWVLLLIGVANPRYFHLPFPGGFINQTSVEIMLFMPLSVLTGYFTQQVFSYTHQQIPVRWIWIHTVLVVVLVSYLSTVGAQKLIACLNPTTILYREGDEAAIVWIKANIPEDETIVINPTGWGYGLYMGNDGGYWISPLTDRATMPPNALYGQNKEKRALTNRFVESILPIGEDAVKIHELLREFGYSYIYIGGRGGVFSPQSLVESPYFKVLYSMQNTWIFKIQ